MGKSRKANPNIDLPSKGKRYPLPPIGALGVAKSTKKDDKKKKLKRKKIEYDDDTSIDKSDINQVGKSARHLTLLQLQNALKRDPESYRQEMLMQLRHYESMTQVLLLQPSDPGEEYGNVVLFLCQVAHCYQKDLADLPTKLMNLLSAHANVMAPSLRRTLIQGLILLKNKNMAASEKVLSLCFELFRCQDKELREMLFTFIINDIKSSNQQHKNNKLNSVLQNFMFTMLTDANETAARKSLEVLIELYKKNVWNDAKTVNVIATACLAKTTKMMVPAIKFFLGDHSKDDSDDEDSDLEDASNQVKHAQISNKVGKKSVRKEKKIESAKKKLARKSKEKKKVKHANFPAIQLLNDPQGFAEKLFAKMKSGNPKPAFDVQLMMMNLISRLIGIHQLFLFEFYSSLINYLQPWQKEVTSILAYLVQACHPLVPPDVLEQPLKAICNKFVSDHCSNEVITVGLNTIREICSRCPHAMNATLLQDLVQYKNARDKGVVMGARSLLALYREVNPALLTKKDRGKKAQETIKDFKEAQYGEMKVAMGVEGIELLEGNDQQLSDDDDEDGWEDMEDNSDESGWEDVEEGDEDDVEEGDEDGWVEVSDEEEGEEESEEEEDEEEESEEEAEKAVKGGEKSKLPTEKKLETEDILEKEKEIRDDVRVDSSTNTATTATTHSRIDQFKILTDEDFARIRKLKAQQELQKLSTEMKGNRKRTLADLELEDSGDDSDDSDDDSEDEEAARAANIVRPESLFAGTKSRKRTYEERIESIQRGREGREKYTSKKNFKDRSSSTNKEKAKGKNFLMMKYKKDVREKAKLSLQDKRTRQIAHIQKMKKAHH